MGKYGRTAVGTQKYRCLNLLCKRQFDPNAKHIPPAIKEIVQQLIADGVPTVKIHKAVKTVSRRWINKQLHKFRSDMRTDNDR